MGRDFAGDGRAERRTGGQRAARRNDGSRFVIRGRWFDRVFELGLPPEALPGIVERLKSAPDRLAQRLEAISEADARKRPGDAWSLAEQAGHLGDLEPLWLGRVDDLVAGGGTLRPADLENRATWAAGHNERPLSEILDTFATRRAAFIERLEALTAEEVRISALHPRLMQPMTVVDLAFFVAEHDDHHLAGM